MGNKVKYNLKNVHYAPITADAEDPTTGFPTYAKPVAIPGAVELAMEQQGSISKFYADGICYWQAAKNNGYEGDLTMALVPDHFRVACLGETLHSADKTYLETAAAKSTPFAFMFEFEGDANSIKHVLYNCTATRPGLNGKTTEEEVEPDTEAITISAAALPNGYVKARTGDETPADKVSGWYNAVYTPSAAAGA